jgi:hypothetical protein
VLLALTALALVAPHCRGQSPSGDKLPLRILYVGHPGSAREADFLTFLRQHFRQVSTANFAGFDGSAAAACDVVLLDYDGDGFKAPRPKLPKDFGRPTVTIGVAPLLWASGQRLKTGYM